MTFNPVSELKRYIDDRLAAADPYRRAVVVAVPSASTVTVRLGLGTTTVQCTSGYPTPRQAGDQVLLLRQPGGGLVALVKLEVPSADTV